MDKLIIVGGPTACGKSAVGIELAKRLKGSIISADSMQVYRGMDIGTAKVTQEEMQGIPHELVSIIDPWEEWNVVRFKEAAKEAVKKTISLNRIPILVGGTGFYIQALLYDIDFSRTRENTQYRNELETKLHDEGEKALFHLLVQEDPESAKVIHPHNVKRVIRALEYKKETGEKISSHNERERRRPAAYDAVFFCLTMERQKLYERIDARVDKMMQNGLLDEVIALQKNGLTRDDVSMQGLGYRQLLTYLDGDCTLDDAVQEIKTQTKHFAKRQLTWFRREKDVLWIHVDDWPSMSSMVDEMVRIIQSHDKNQEMR